MIQKPTSEPGNDTRNENDVLAVFDVLGKEALPSSSKESEKGLVNPRVDLRVKDNAKYKVMFPDFYFSSSLNGWFCKTCPNFAPGSGMRSFIEKPSGFGDHPSNRFALHLGSKRHLEAVRNMQVYKEFQSRLCMIY